MKPPEPILVLELFAPLREGLLTLLESLSAEDWDRPTVCASWCVKDVAAHLLGGDLGILSRRRDAFTPPGQSIHGWDDLVALINQLNDAWVKATRRLSPRVLCDLLRWTGPQVEAYFASLDPLSIGAPVAWAGAAPAPLWLDLAREFTERWHHQQQIRDAVGRPGFKDRRFLAPVLDAFVRALPHTYRDVAAADGTTVQLTISGEAGSDWLLLREHSSWTLLVGSAAHPSAHVILQQDDAWRLFTKGLRKDQIRSRVALQGDLALAEKALDMISIIG